MSGAVPVLGLLAILGGKIGNQVAVAPANDDLRLRKKISGFVYIKARCIPIPRAIESPPSGLCRRVFGTRMGGKNICGA